MDWNEVLMTIVTTVLIPAVIILGKALYGYIEEHIKDEKVKKYHKKEDYLTFSQRGYYWFISLSKEDGLYS